ncbi:MAG: hypothetical protein EHM70_22640 [Chloroflexota bacterium]|nr:MAG: hypothetical protein EHM70_22640 [Chloroflexota bacterium]
MAVNSMDYSGKNTVLDVIRKERERFYEIIDDPKNWNVQTRCTEWEVRDMVGHMIDVTEGYLKRWDKARKGEPIDTAGLLVMSDQLNQKAQSFRTEDREAAIRRLKTASDKMMDIFDRLTPEEWSGFMVTHPFMGPLPTLFYTGFHVMDYGVHTWDMQWGMGEKNARLDERTAGVLVPYMFVLMQSTVDQESVEGIDAEVGVIVDGEWGGKWRMKIKDGALTYTPDENLDDVDATFHFKNASDFVLTTFQRFPGGETSGDPGVIDQVRRMFFRI